MKWEFRNLATILLCYFAMGYVDIVGIAANFLREDLALSDTEASLVAGSLYLWFLICPVPTSIFAGRCGKWISAVIGLALCSSGLITSVLCNNFATYLGAFSMIGIGCTILMTILNPMVAESVDKFHLASTLTIGQSIKYSSALAAPLLAGAGASGDLDIFGTGWKSLLLIFAMITLCILALSVSCANNQNATTGSRYKGVLHLLKDKRILLAVAGILCVVGIDVCTSITAPKLVCSRLGIPMEKATMVGTVYFAAKFAITIAATYLLLKISVRQAYFASLVCISMAIAILASGTSAWTIIAGICVMGVGNANICTLIITNEFSIRPDNQLGINNLIVMGLSGGAIIPFLAGIASDKAGEAGVMAIIAAATVYLLLYGIRFIRTTE